MESSEDKKMCITKGGILGRSLHVTLGAIILVWGAFLSLGCGGKNDEASITPTVPNSTSLRPDPPQGPVPLFPDGTLITAPGLPVCMIETGQCRCIPDDFTFVAGGWHGENVRVVSEAELSALPRGPDIPRAESLIIDTEPTDLGVEHWMHTRARVNRVTGRVEVNTRIWTGTAEGFHGAVAIILTDADGVEVLALPDQKQQRHYGVDGKGLGTSFRDENWTFQVDPSEASRIASVQVIQS